VLRAFQGFLGSKACLAMGTREQSRKNLREQGGGGHGEVIKSVFGTREQRKTFQVNAGAQTPPPPERLLCVFCRKEALYNYSKPFMVLHSFFALFIYQQYIHKHTQRLYKVQQSRHGSSPKLISIDVDDSHGTWL
jgi:hypothetical protein